MQHHRPDQARPIDDNQDDLGRDVNDKDNRIGDRPIVDRATTDHAPKQDNLHRDDDAPNSRIDDL